MMILNNLLYMTPVIGRLLDLRHNATLTPPLHGEELSQAANDRRKGVEEDSHQGDKNTCRFIVS